MKNFIYIIIAIIGILIMPTTIFAGEWRYGQEVAVSLSYDDGYPSILSVAVPHLNQYGRKGTFYLNSDYTRLYRPFDIPGWRQAYLQGHEIGNHGKNHICAGVNRYNTPDDVINQIRDSNNWINNNIGIDPFRTFAYPCSETVVQFPDGSLQEQPYFDAVDRYHYAGRIGKGATFDASAYSLLNDPAQINHRKIKSIAVYSGRNDNLAQIKTFLESSEANGKWIVFTFHTIDGPVLPVSAAFHRSLVEYLYTQRNRYWTAPVRDVYGYVINKSYQTGSE